MKRVRRLAVPALIALVLGASCSGDDDNSTAIDVQVEGEPEDIRIYERIAEDFERANAGIEVRIRPTNDDQDHLAKLTTAFAAGTPPDVFLLNYREFSQFVSLGAIQPIGDRLSEAERAAYHAPPIEAFTVNGTLQCLPQNTSSLVVYYNRRLFAEAGLAHPDSWTWEQFRSTAIRLTNGDVKGLGIRPSIIRLAPFVWSNGGEVVDDEVRPTRFVLDQPAARRALQFVLQLVREDRVVPSQSEVAAQGLEDRFAAGKLGMLLASRRETPRFREISGLDWDVAPLPVAVRPAGILHSDGFCIARRSRNLDAAVRFVRFAAGEQGQRTSSLAGRVVPSLRSLTAGSIVDLLPPPEHSAVFVDAIPSLRRTPVVRTWPRIEDVTGELLTRAFSDPGTSVDEVLAEIDRATRPLFAEAAEGADGG